MDEVDLLDEGQRTGGRRTRVDSDCDVVPRSGGSLIGCGATGVVEA